ncbi:MAG: hypothetical protein J7M39_11655 [Anaerolineae bacterium]|nr:hypothetical protein [Anaerolineae bacterium]
MATAEFALEREWESDRSGPGRWVFSHAARHKPAILGMLAGAVGNALLAVAQPILTGRHLMPSTGWHEAWDWAGARSSRRAATMR